MGWFSRTPKTDPVGDICRVLVERPWEWSPITDKGELGDADNGLVHVSAIRVYWKPESHWTGFGYRPKVWIGDSYSSIPYENRPADRIMAAVLQRHAVMCFRSRADYDSVANVMADAVKRGDRDAARQLADMIMELEGGTPRG